MPQALEVDHEQVKCIAIQIGYREAARQLGLNEDTVMSWAKREGWSEQVKQVEQAQQVKLEKQGLQAIARKSPAEIILAIGNKSKLLQAKVVHKTAKALNKKDGEALIPLAQVVKLNVDSADKLFGYSQPVPNLTQINVNLVNSELRDSPK